MCVGSHNLQTTHGKARQLSTGEMLAPLRVCKLVSLDPLYRRPLYTRLALDVILHEYVFCMIFHFEIAFVGAIQFLYILRIRFPHKSKRLRYSVPHVVAVLQVAALRTLEYT